MRPNCGYPEFGDISVSIHAPREGCDRCPPLLQRGAGVVSIHAPREGCDPRGDDELARLLFVSIHAPREGCDLQVSFLLNFSVQFQFTHPGRGATQGTRRDRQLPTVSIHAPREGCDGRYCLYRSWYGVSIHAPREGCDLQVLSPLSSLVQFQFTHPGRGATHPKGCREQPAMFQFTHPGRGATKALSLSPMSEEVSIHAPREGCDPIDKADATLLLNVSIHAPREGCDLLSHS